MKKLSVVIPCYRSEKTIRNVVLELREALKSINDYEVILVDDGSPDKVWDEIEKLSLEFREIHGILLSRNFGQHAALMAGYRKAEGEIVVTMDDDGQSDPGGIKQLIQKAEEGYDVVYARYPAYQKSSFRVFGSWMNRKMSEAMIGKPKTIQGNSFYLMKRFIRDEIIRYTGSYPYIGGLIFRATQNIGEVEIQQRSRKEGVSGYSLIKLMGLWLNGFTAFSVKPLRMASLLGIFSAFGGFLVGISTVIRKLLNPNILMGYSSLLAAIFFIGGVLMMLLGVIGEYVGRIYISLNNAPQYVIKMSCPESDGDT